jgi:predicted ester cyclase
LATDRDTSEPGGTGRQGEELIRHITDKVVNGGDLTIVRELFSARYVAHKTGLSLPRGPEAFKMSVRQWRDAFPDFRVTIEDIFEKGEFVACLFVSEGTHLGSLLGIPPSEKTFRFTGTDVHHVVDGLVAESWLADDIPRILTDLGIMAPTNTRSAQWT